MHVDEPAVAYEPTLQLMQPAKLAVPAEEYVPALQLRHTVDIDAAEPTVVEYVPPLHAVQVLAPVNAYVPATHDVQAVLLMAPLVDENVPVGQLRHETGELFEVVEAYVPALQFVHVEEPKRAYEPAEQAKQVSDDVAPTPVENVPAAQERQA